MTKARFVAAYLGAPPDAYQAARLWLMQQAGHMLFAIPLRRMVRAQRPQLRITELGSPPRAELRRQLAALMQSPEGQLRYRELDANLRSPRFAEALQIVRG